MLLRRLLLLGFCLSLTASVVAQHAHGPGRSPYAWPAASELVGKSHTIVAGEVMDMRSAWNRDRSRIWTTVTLRVERTLRGEPRPAVQFRVPGGTVGDTRLTMTHTPRFRVGERALVFLSGDPGRLPRVTAGEAGKRALWRDEDGAEQILPPIALSDETPTLRTLDEFADSLSKLQ